MPRSRIAPMRLTAPIRLTVGAAAAQGTNVPCHGVLLKAVSPGQTVYIGVTSSLTTATGFPLADGAELDLEVRNLNQLWFIASAASQGLSVLPYSFY